MVALASFATLTTAGVRLCRALSRVLSVSGKGMAQPIAVARVSVARNADHPLRWQLLVGASMSLRGPPAGFAR